MNREDMVNTLVEHTGAKKKDVRSVLEALPGLIRGEVVENGSFRYHGLGTFSLVQRAARQGRNPRTGEPIPVPAKNGVKFKPHSSFLIPIAGALPSPTPAPPKDVDAVD